MSLLATWIDGRVLRDPNEPCLTAGDRGFLLGDAAFETIRVSRGVAVCVERHLARLSAACAALGIEVHALPSAEDVASFVDEAGHAECVLRVTVSRGAQGRGLLPAEGSPTRVMTLSPAPPPVAELDVFLARPFACPGDDLSALKLANRAAAIVQARPDAEGLILWSDHVHCGLTSNLFVVQGERLATPPAGDLVRAGVTRERVLDRAARECGLIVEERAIPVAELEQCDGLLLTNAVRGVQPAHTVEGRRPEPWNLQATRGLCAQLERALAAEPL